MPWRKKIVIIVMFSGAFLEMAFGILRAVSILTVSKSYNVLMMNCQEKITISLNHLRIQTNIRF